MQPLPLNQLLIVNPNVIDLKTLSKEIALIHPDLGAYVGRLRHPSWKQWMGKKGEYRGAGRWTVRIQRAWKDKTGNKLDEDTLAKLGTLLHPYMNIHPNPIAVALSKIDWTPGDFHDTSYGISAGSCWWWDNQKMATAWNEHGGLAMKFYESEEHYQMNPKQGIGRCFLMQDDDIWYLINVKGGVNAEQAATAFGLLIGQPAYRCDVHLSSYVRYTDGTCFSFGKQVGRHTLVV